MLIILLLLFCLVVLDASGFSKGYGFIRFGDEQEQQTALISMMGISGLGSKPLKVSAYRQLCMQHFGCTKAE